MIAKNKRVVSDYNLTDMLLWEWLDPKSFGAQQVYSKAFKKLIEKLRQDFSRWIRLINKYGLDNILSSFCWSVVNVEIGYIGDTDRFKRVDWWELPTECWNWKLGDCEDSTFLLGSALENVKSMTKRKDDMFLCTIGYYVTVDKVYYGHAYVLYFNSYYKKWYVLETTWDKEVSPFIWFNWNPEMHVPAVLFNRKVTLRMDLEPFRKKLDLTNAWYERHEKAIKEMIEYITTGKKLECSFMHKKVRPVPIRIEDMTAMT